MLERKRRPRHPDFENRTAGSLANAFTCVMGSRSVWTVAKRTRVLHGVYDAHTGPAREQAIPTGPARPAGRGSLNRLHLPRVLY